MLRDFFCEAYSVCFDCSAPLELQPLGLLPGATSAAHVSFEARDCVFAQRTHVRLCAAHFGYDLLESLLVLHRF